MSTTDLTWARSTKPGDYLCHYDDDDLDERSDPGSRCGRSDVELADIQAELRKRDLVLEADDRGLVARKGQS